MYFGLFGLLPQVVKALYVNKCFNSMALCQGTTSVVPFEARGKVGFSPCGFFSYLLFRSG
jgi:hypothetical protein